MATWKQYAYDACQSSGLQLGNYIPQEECGKDAFRYDDPHAATGARRAMLVDRLPRLAAIAVSGRGSRIAAPVLPVAGPVTAQLVTDGAAVCKTRTFTKPQKNTPRVLKAK